MVNVTNSRKPVKPVQGKCRWLVRIGETGVGALEISGKPYVVTVLEDRGQVSGFRLEKTDGKTYEIDASTWECSCPDCTYRGRACKHTLALQAALAAASK